MELKLTEMYSYETNKDYAYRTIKENIMELELAPGELISEKELADSLNISRTPIREILFKLQNLNLIESTAQGNRVTLIDISLIDESLNMRQALEKEVILRLQKNRPSDCLKELEYIVDLQEFYLKKGHRSDSYEQDRSFHREMYKYAGRERTWELIKGFSTHFDRIRRIKNMYDSPEDLAGLVAHHREYLRMIREKSGGQEIMKLLDRHTGKSYRSWYREIIKSQEWKDISKMFKDCPSEKRKILISG